MEGWKKGWRDGQGEDGRGKDAELLAELLATVVAERCGRGWSVPYSRELDAEIREELAGEGAVPVN